MIGWSAVIFVPDDTAKTGYPQPLMLQSTAGAPLLAWLANALFDSGVGRFFLVCHDRFLDAARACMPQAAQVMTAQDSSTADLMHVFLSTADDSETEVTVVAGPAVFVPSLPGAAGAVPSSICRVSRERLMDALDRQLPFSRFLRENGTCMTEVDGVYPVESPADILTLSALLRRDRALRLMKSGVEIIDETNCYIDPAVQVGAGATLLPGTILRGNTVIGEGSVIGPWSTVTNAQLGKNTVVNASVVEDSVLGDNVSVGPYANLRTGCTVAAGAKLGAFVELKNVRVGQDAQIPHLSYLGDAVIGDRANIGCGTVTANFDRVNKHETTVGEDAFVGCNTVLVAPVTVGGGAYVAAGSAITEDIPPQALGLARAHQSVKKDWAAKHKKP